MKRILTLCLAVWAIGFCLAPGSASAAEVSQGKCIQYDAGAQRITLEEYDTQFSDEHPYGKPTGVEISYDVGHAQIGITPEPGDILRMAWVAGENGKSALRVMNVSKQDLRKK